MAAGNLLILKLPNRANLNRWIFGWQSKRIAGFNTYETCRKISAIAGIALDDR
jgi:hypothetical protein